MYDQREAEKILEEIKSHTNDGYIKNKIIELSSIYEVGIIEKNPYLLAKIRAQLQGKEEITPRDICNFICKLKEKNFSSISTSWIYKCLPNKFKKEKVAEHLVKSMDISDGNLYAILPEIKERIKRIERGEDYRSQDIKIKEKVDELEKYDWDCWLAQELAKLAIKMESEHKSKPHDENLCRKYSKHVKTARDARFATTLSNYEAIVVACSSFKSLADVAEGEWEFLSLWEVLDNMRKCRECKDMNDCASRKCNHICHKIVKPMTTKGLKYAIKTNPDLKELQEEMNRLMEEKSDLCSIAKILFKNKKTDKFMNMNDKKNILARHIEKTDCFSCQDFLNEHPNFFAE